MPIKVTRSSNDYLEHHGILGQKWGKRNGPPYPLKAEDHSPSEEKAGWEKSVSRATNVYEKARKIKKVADESIERNNPNQKHSEEEKLSKRKPWDEKLDTEFKGTNITNKTWSKKQRNTAISVGVAVVAAYGIYKCAKFIDDDEMGKLAMKSIAISGLAASSILKSKTANSEKHTRLTDYENDEEKNNNILSSYKKIETPEQPASSMHKTNPEGGTVNCMYCTTAMEMRQRGYDVSAAYEKGNGLTFNDYKKAWPDAKTDIIPEAQKAFAENASDDDFYNYLDYIQNHTMTKESLTKTLTDLYGNNARGNLMIADSIFGSAHSVYFTITDGKVDAYDGQTSEHYKLGEPGDLLSRYTYTSSIRFDDSEPNMQMLEPLLKRK